MGLTIHDSSAHYIIAGALSMPMTMFVIYTFIRFPTIRLHPGDLMVGRSVMDFAFALLLLLMGLLVGHEDHEKAFCQHVGALSMFFYGGSQAYFMGMCFSIYSTLKYPLRSPSITSRNVHIFVLVFSIVMVTASYIGDVFGYRPEDNICFYKEDKKTFPFYLFVVPLIIGAIMGVTSSIFAGVRLNSGIRQTFEVRRRSIRQHLLLVICYLLLTTIWSVLVATNGEANFSILISCATVGTSLIDALTWYFQKFRKDFLRRISRFRFQYDDLLLGANGVDGVEGSLAIGTEEASFIDNRISTNRAMAGHKNISDALRKEIIIFMSEGILTSVCKASTQASERSDSDRIIAADFPSHIHLQQFRSGTFGGGKTSLSPKINLFTPSSKHNRLSPLSPDSKKPRIQMDSTLDAPNSMETAIDVTDVDEEELSMDHTLMEAELKNQQKSPINTFELTMDTSSEKAVIFYDFAPHLFRYLRIHVFDCDDESFMASHTMTDDITESVTAKFSEGASGAFFFLTPDSKFLLKTVTEAEAYTFLRILPGYFEHMRKYPHSLLTRFYGLYSLHLYHTTLYFCVMKNAFVPGLEPHEKYDLKGSWVSRHTQYHIELGKLMKDEDLHKSLLLSHTESKTMWDQLKHDSRFLQSMNIMDYSLLLGIYNVGVDSHHINSSSAMNWLFKPAMDASTRVSYVPPSVSRHDQLLVPRTSAATSSSPDEIRSSTSQDVSADNISQYLAGASSKEPHPDNVSTQPSTVLSSDAFNRDGGDLKGLLGHTVHVRRRAFTSGNGLEEVKRYSSTYSARTVEGPGFYCLALIDMLQEWTWQKKVERFIKVYILCKDANGVSAIEPHAYRKRFLGKMLQIGIGRKTANV